MNRDPSFPPPHDPRLHSSPSRPPFSTPGETVEKSPQVLAALLFSKSKEEKRVGFFLCVVNG